MNKNVLMLAFHRNESRYIREWVEWNLFAGASKIVLYDNNINDLEEECRTRKELQPYILSGEVDMVRWHHMEGRGTILGVPVPHRGQSRYIKNRKHHSVDDGVRRYPGYDIVVKIDIDEFVMPIDQKPLRNVWLRLRDDMLKNNVKAVRLKSCFFGTNFLENPPSEKYSVVQTYTRREENPSNFKDVAQQKWVSCCGASSHYWNLRWSMLEYSVCFGLLFVLLFYSWKRIRDRWIVWILIGSLMFLYDHCQNAFQWSRVRDQSIAKLHHYYTKSKSEFYTRRKYSPRNSGMMKKDDLDQLFSRNDRFNQVEDRSGQAIHEEFRVNQRKK